MILHGFAAKTNVPRSQGEVRFLTLGGSTAEKVHRDCLPGEVRPPRLCNRCDSNRLQVKKNASSRTFVSCPGRFAAAVGGDCRRLLPLPPASPLPGSSAAGSLAGRPSRASARLE